jgi:hypothetical protein
MLFCDDVFDVVGQITVSLVKLAVFRNIPRPIPGRAAMSRHPSLLRGSLEVKFGLQLQNGYEISRVDEPLIFVTLFRA